MVSLRVDKPQSSHGQNKLKATNKYPDSFEAKQLFINSALAMSWQMAIAVLIPVIGGYYLDKYFNTNPWLTIVGFLVAIVLVAVIVKKTINQLPEYTKPKGSK